MRFIKLGLITILTLYVGLFLYFKFGWRNHYPKQQIDGLIFTIQNTPKLSDSFYIVYDKTYSNRHEKITTRYWKGFWTEFITIKKPIHDNWQFVTANMQPYKGFRYKIAPMALAFRINNDVSPEKCFDYVMTECFKTYAKEFKIDGALNNLISSENIINFIVAYARPRYYKIHPTQYRQEIDSLKLIILKE